MACVDISISKHAACPDPSPILMCLNYGGYGSLVLVELLFCMHCGVNTWNIGWRMQPLATVLNTGLHSDILLSPLGHLNINGTLVTPNDIKGISAYVQQQDLAFATLTVREHLRFQVRTAILLWTRYIWHVI